MGQPRAVTSATRVAWAYTGNLRRHRVKGSLNPCNYLKNSILMAWGWFTVRIGNEIATVGAREGDRPGSRKRRGKIRTRDRTRHESFYLLAEQYTAASVEPIPVWARHGWLALKGKSLIRSGQEIRGIKVHRNGFEGMGR